MKLLVFLVTIAVVSNISISFSGNTLQYEKYLFLESPPKTHDQTPWPQLDNVDSFELIPRDLLSLRHQRGLLRAETLSSSSSSSASSAPVSQQLFNRSGAYMMTLGVGTPPQNVYMLLDTGSSISWLQCRPCKKCYKQSDPIFDPQNSSTFSPVACGDSRCKQLQHHNLYGCSGNHNKTCLYNATYMDDSFSKGTFSNETLTLGPGATKLENISFGCGHDNQGNWAADSAGLLGLGRGSLSFITQTKDLFKSQFSYCLAFWFSDKNSSIVFGPSAVPTDQTAVYTPLIYTNTTTTFYYVNLTGISVNGTRVPGIDPSVFDLKPNGDDGGVIFDSGTTITQLVKEAYEPLREAFRAAINSSTPGPPLNYSAYDTCYDISPENFTNVQVPTVELHFDRGANMLLPPDSTMIVFSADTYYTLCFAFVQNEQNTTIGNFQQKSFQMVYDLQGSRLGFVPDSC